MMKTKLLTMCVLAAVLAIGSAAQASLYNVNPGDSIQAAINAAADGDTINVAAGTYDEVITINKAISLYGAGSASTTLTYTNSGAQHEQLIFLGTNTGATINGSATIEGFTLRHGAGLTGDNNLIKFRASSSGGLLTIQNNVFDQAGTDITAIEEAYGASNFVIQNNQFNSNYAVWLNSAHDGTISGNTMTGSRIGMGGSGASGDNPRDIAVTGNTIDGASYGMVLANNIERIAVTGNDILNCTSAGVLYWDYGSYESWVDVVFNNNNIVGNAAGFAGYTTTALPTLVDATQNWWGDAGGPSGGLLDPVTSVPANGMGDSIGLSNLSFDPWVVPEPATIALLGLGALGLIRRKRGV